MVGAVALLPACRTGRSFSGAGGDPPMATFSPQACHGQFEKKLQDMTADLQKMGDQDYRVEMAESGSEGGVTIYARTMPRAVRQYLTASHVDSVPQIQQASHRGYYQIRPRPNSVCGLDYQVRFVAP
jgi:hypothetical protein